MAEVKGIQVDRVTAWYQEHVPDTTPPLDFSLIVGGHSNLTYRVTDAAGRRTVLRRPPLGAVLATAHDMGREHRIISSLGPTRVPVPPTLGLCNDPSVNDAPFYVMGFVDGLVLDEAEITRQHFDEAACGRIGEHVIEVLADLHAVDPDAVGLGDLGRKESYLARQLERWRGQWEKSKTRELPAMEQVHDVLAANIPPQEGASVVHGDYRLGNMLTTPAGQIAAVLDWELCTLGDPLADLGYLMNNWAEPGDAGPALRGAAVSPTGLPGFPTRAEMLRRYAARTGRSTQHIDYYRAFQYWRLAAIVEGVMARYLKGVMGSEANTDLFRSQIDGLADSAVDMLRRLDAL